MRKLTLSMFVFLLSLAGLQAQSSCTDLNGYVDSKNTSGTGAYTLQLGQEEMAAQTYYYSGPGKVSSVRIYGNYPGVTAGVPLRVGISNVDANGRPTTSLQTQNATWWWFNNAAGYITVNFGSGGVYVSNNFAVTVEVRTASPWGNSFQLQYTGNGEGRGQDLASLAGTSTGNNWTSAMNNFNKDGDFYLVPRMVNDITPAFDVNSQCVATNSPVSFTNQSAMTTDSMFNTIGLLGYSGNLNFYSWDFGDASAISHATNPTHSYATAGSYTVTLTCTIDGWNNDCSYTTTKVVSVGLGLTATAVNATCNGSTNGSITITGTGGTPPYMYSIDNGAYQSSATFSNLAAGTYATHIMDAMGCTSSGVITVTQPSAIVITNISSTNSSCGNADGALLVTATGGTGTLQYELNNLGFQASGQFNNLLSDFYTITVKDANNCTTSNYGIVNDQGAPVLTIVSQTNVSCFGGNDGTIVMSATGGSGQLQYSINGGNNWQVSGSFLNLVSGTYLCMVKDASGCSSAIKITISQPNGISFLVSSTPVECNGGNDGSIIVTSAIGGTGTFSYSINNINFQSSNVFTNVTAGTYTVYVRDIAQCVGTSTVTVTQPSALTASTQITNVTCNGAFTGAVTITATGGTAPYTYSINSEDFQTSNIFSELESGSYTVIVRDAHGCQYITTISIAQPTLIAAAFTIGSSTCGNANGTMLVTGSGGSGSGYQYSIDGTNFNSSGSFSGLLSGTYDVIVHDGAGCENVFTVSVTDANGPTIVSTSHTNLSCNGSDDGTITINSVTGGSGVLMYSVGSVWQLSNVFNGLAAGTYTVLVKDANGCVGETTITLTEPTAIVVTTTIINVACHGDNSGSVTINAAGGAGTLAYGLDGETGLQSSNVFNNLYAGTYLAVVRDAAGCTGYTYFIVTEPNPIFVGVGVLNVMCNGGSNGAIYVNAAGGTGTLTYSLNGINYQSSSTFSGLTAGAYTVYVKDSNGCVVTSPMTVAEPAVLTVLAHPTNVVCSGGNDGVVDITVTGGTYPYTFDWSTGATTEDVFNLVAGTYSVTVTDANGCSSTQSYTITQPATALIVNGVIVDESVPQAADGGVSVTVTGGTGPYTYLWSNGATTASISGVSSGIYTVLVTDANGCTTSDVYFVGVASGIAAVVNPEGVNLYPNPAHETFTIDAGANTIDKLEVMDVLGQVVYAAEPKTAIAHVNTDGLSQGVYFVRLSFKGGVVTKRVEVSK